MAINTIKMMRVYSGFGDTADTVQDQNHYFWHTYPFGLMLMCGWSTFYGNNWILFSGSRYWLDLIGDGQSFWRVAAATMQFLWPCLLFAPFGFANFLAYNATPSINVPGSSVSESELVSCEVCRVRAKVYASTATAVGPPLWSWRSIQSRTTGWTWTWRWPAGSGGIRSAPRSWMVSLGLQKPSFLWIQQFQEAEASGAWRSWIGLYTQP